MPESPWYIEEKSIQRLRKDWNARMDGSYKTCSPLWEALEGSPFHMALINIFLKSSAIALSCRLEITVGMAASHLGSENVMRMIGSHGGREQVEGL